MKKTVIWLAVLILAFTSLACVLTPTLPSIFSTNQNTQPTARPVVVPTRSGNQPSLTTTAPDLVNLEGSLTALYQRVSPAVVYILIASDEGSSSGSGFLISSSGEVVTNYHVVENAKAIEVDFSDGLKTTAEVIGTDMDSDLAVLRVAEFPSDVLPLSFGNSDLVQPGQVVAAIGNPFGLTGTMTLGIVSAKGRTLESLRTSDNGSYFTAGHIIQTDAAINPGNSGGPLINMQGQVVGINTAIVASGQGIGFATPINMAKEILPELKTTGEVARGWLGVAIQDVTPEIARAVGLKEAKGAMVTSVYAGDPADKAGMKPGDIILKIEGRDVSDPRALTRIIGSLKPNARVTLVVWREGRSLNLTTKLQKRLEEHVAGMEKGPGDSEGTKDRLGLTVVNITPQVQQQYNLEDTAGVLVVGMDPKGSASRGQIQKMDIIREVDRHVVNNVTQYLKAIAAKKKGQTVLLLIQRGVKPLYVAVDVK